MSIGSALLLLVLCLSPAFVRSSDRQTVTIARRPRLPLLFAPDSLWRRNISGLPAASSSREQIEAAYGALLGSTIGAVDPVSLIPSPPGVNCEVAGFLNPPIYYTRPNDTTISVPNVDYDGTSYGDNITVPRPSSIFIVPTGPRFEYSNGIAVLVTDNLEAFDLYQVTTYSLQGLSKGGGYLGPIQAIGEMHKIDLEGQGDVVQPAILPSAPSASRMPLLAGVLLPEDVERGVIEHVLAVTYPQFRNQNPYSKRTSVVRDSDFYAPCPAGMNTGSSWRQHALGACQLLRLNPRGTLVTLENQTIDESQFAPITQMVLRAFRTYGVMPTTVGPSMSIITESLVTAFLNLTDERAGFLMGGRPVLPELSFWYQLLLVLARDLSFIPLGSQNQAVNVFSLLSPDNLQIDTPNWQVVGGGVGTTDVGESFVVGYSYFGSIDVVLIIIACCFFLPFAGIAGYLLISRQAEEDTLDRTKDLTQSSIAQFNMDHELVRE